METMSIKTKEAPDVHGIEELARRIEAVRGMLCPILCPKGAPSTSPRGAAGYNLQAQAYKTCAASLAAAAAALRVFVAQADMSAAQGASHE